MPGESHGQRTLASYSPWGHKELDITDHTHSCHNYWELLTIYTISDKHTDSDEVGLNILTDDRYRAEDIKAAAKLIVSEPQGTAVYTILDAGAKEPVTKDVAWTTITYGGQEWRVGVTSIR